MNALEIFNQSKDSIDLVITDKTMPKMTGFDLAQHIHEIKPDIPIILCTGFGEKKDTDKAEALCIKAFIMKPVENEELAKTVRQVLDAT